MTCQKCLCGCSRYFHAGGSCVNHRDTCRVYLEEVRTHAEHSDTPRIIHSAPYRPENHAALCHCGFEQCERRKIRIQKESQNGHSASENDTQVVNDTPEWNEPAKKDAETVIKDTQTDMTLRKHGRKAGII